MDLKGQVFLFAGEGAGADDLRVGYALADALSAAYSKNVCLLGIGGERARLESVRDALVGDKRETTDIRIIAKKDDFTKEIEEAEASMLVFETGTKRGDVMYRLELCRELRIPYFFCRAEHKVGFGRVLVPITFLIEEREKGPFSSSFGKFLKSQITLMKANDYGSRAQQTVDAIDELLVKAGVTHDIRMGRKDSFKVELEAALLAADEGYELVVCSASREYGIDDVLFGPKELKIIRKSTVPVMLINPRGDLYTLCG